ncbi:molybdopterin converting factor, subunit 2 [gamma proteobacterium NOR5-3]|nr:molybdopterin converting factor, subunit 2 [gamma proteobacterium NOR5-3]
MFSVAISKEPLDVSALTRDFPRSAAETGAVVTFTGFVRGEGISALALEHYPGMTEQSILDSIHSAARRWPVQSVQVVHRVGELAAGEPIVWLAVGAGHRAAAFSACEFVMDYLKISAPLWKRERDLEGNWHWVDAKIADRDRARRWGGGAIA